MASPASGFVAASIAAAALAGLGVQSAVLFAGNHSAGLTLWILLRYFTILTNVLVVVVFGLAAGGLRKPSLLAGTVLSIALVGVVYGLLLHGLVELSGGSAVANALLHDVTPAGSVIWWLALAPKGGLRWRDPLLWALFPLGYLGYALVRGAWEGLYAYPFLDVPALGWLRVAGNAAGLAVCFLACGYLMVWGARSRAGVSGARL
ncbi:hypothetical protein ESZ00_15185 [Silvibacterium dinghuense]|uniref:Pr6Pr family membrane protein n=1 Tax=Silvibacterium dinghuense TaxID=1560006 RepID=A0A4Q1SBX5_9BACT|nr:hypothetical protein ESZ00_15185 [Silvibacterium dinghuense]